MKNKRKLKKSCYEDWKLGVIDETDYYEYITRAMLIK